MSEATIIVPSLLLGLASGFIGGIATGGGMLSIPGLMLIGLPPSSAIATNNLCISSSITSAFRYHQSSIIQRYRILPFLLLDFMGGIVGSKLLLYIDEQILQRVFGAVCVGLALVFALNKTGTSKNRSRAYDLIGLLAMFLTGIFAGLFGTGGGFFTVYILSYFYGMTVIEANANAKLISLGGAVSPILIFLHAGIINFNAGIPLMVGSAVGGYIGAHTAIKKGDAKVKMIFTIIVLISGTKLILS